MYVCRNPLLLKNRHYWWTKMYHITWAKKDIIRASDFNFLMVLGKGSFGKFTSEKTDLTPTDKLFMMNLDQTEFMGFSFLNPEFVEHV
ncbi:hypothetical protein NQ314_017895 [Rhamnusium bicolor]|uniref:Protein kinase C-terminal domain-containing protein n=1 Tax=Rhamnusium bicolor TaxID=1586634 RepID=A0AAV8WSN1_9CUCU|nr:hypothetical protein NQ314_017895 [Rhamnusium bicolor]